MHISDKMYNITPRNALPDPNVEHINIKRPPAQIERESSNIFALVMQCLIATVNFALISFVLTQDLNIVLLCAAISAFGTLITGIVSRLIQKKKEKATYDDNERTYQSYLATVQNQIYTYRVSYDSYYSVNHPSFEVKLNKLVALSDSIWGRRVLDNDFMEVRLGMLQNNREFDVATRPDFADIKLKPEHQRQIEHLLSLGYSDTPFKLNLKSRPLGIIGDNNCTEIMLGSILSDLTYHHCYTDLKIVVLSSNDSIEYAKSAKHFFDYSNQIPLYGHSYESSRQALNDIRQLMLSRKNSKLSGIASSVPVPFYVIVIFDIALLDSQDIELINYCIENSLSISAIYCNVSYNNLPYNTATLRCDREAITMHESSTLQNRFTPDAIDKTKLISFFKHISPLSIDLEYIIPYLITFFQGYSVQNAKELNVLQRWNESRDRIDLAVPVGVNSKGEPFFLDIHERAHGPHGLIAGTTGSGKSEFLLSYMLSLAITFPPDMLAFMIVDYKGGGFAKQLHNLPHLKDTLTNLSGDSCEQFAEKLKSELFNRTKLFSTVAVSNIEKYNQSNQTKIPRLLVVFDEFAELKKEQPQFIQEIISIARIGRSLGVHLLLCTQKPVGVVDDQIWSNSRLKLCFRVNDAMESREVLGDDTAAKFRFPGRAAISSESGMVDVFQAYLCAKDIEHEMIWSSRTPDDIVTEILSAYQLY